MTTASEKYDERVRIWKSPSGVRFASQSVEQPYQQRVQMLVDAIELKKPKRVPVALNVGFYACTYAGITPKEGTYDYAKLAYAIKKFNADFLPDTLTSAFYCGPGKALEIVDYKAFNWPGHGVAETAPFQCVDQEYMTADEYDLLMNDPTNYFIHRYLPRTFGACGPLANLSSLTEFIEYPFSGGALVPFGLPEVQEAFRRILEAGKAAFEWAQAASAIDNETKASIGLPALVGGFSKAPYDTLGDTLRGTKAIMLDKFRRPKQ